MWRQWAGDYVVFNPLSGNTHLLDIASGEVLEALISGAAQTGELARRLADFIEVDNDAGVMAALERILESLDELGLAEPVPRC